MNRHLYKFRSTILMKFYQFSIENIIFKMFSIEHLLELSVCLLVVLLTRRIKSFLKCFKIRVTGQMFTILRQKLNVRKSDVSFTLCNDYLLQVTNQASRINIWSLRVQGRNVFGEGQRDQRPRAAPIGRR